jgi:hypothetical protein
VPPGIRKRRSKAANALGAVLSLIVITIRNLENASQATNRTAFTPPVRGPSPESYCSHLPGSVVLGR